MLPLFLPQCSIYKSRKLRSCDRNQANLLLTFGEVCWFQNKLWSPESMKDMSQAALCWAADWTHILLCGIMTPCFTYKDPLDIDRQTFILGSIPIHVVKGGLSNSVDRDVHGLRTPREEIAYTERPKIHSHSQIFRYGRSIFCLPHRPNFSDIFDLCLHWVSVVRGFHHPWIIF